MRRVVLLALLALALPVTAFASSYDFVLGGGTISVTSTSATISTDTLFLSTNGGAFTSTTGTASISLSLSGTSITGGSISLSSGGIVFNGTFSGQAGDGFTAATTSHGTEFSFHATFSGTLMVNGQSIPTDLTIASGQSVEGSCKNGPSNCTLKFVSGDVTINTVPEPGTLGLLGTGLVGLAGLARRKFIN